VTRRELLRRALLGGAAAWVGHGRLLGQDAQRPDSSDRLYDPSMVQQRAATTAADNDAAIKTLEHRLKCTCGCNLDVYTCRTTDFTCTYSPALHREVVALRQEGKAPDAVVAAFVAKYGEQILMAPKPEGFNLAAYLLPGALVLGAGGLLAAVLLRRSRRAALAVVHPLPESGATAADDERLRRALADIED
jgi:cytochrome c-type biogenesis protein CcmH/NrfF